jgi:hypothetical protein
MNCKRFLTSVLLAVALSLASTAGGGDQSGRELLLQLGPDAQSRSADADLQAQSPVSQPMTIVGQKRVLQPPPRQRDPRITPDQLVVVCVDSEGRELFRTLVPDPRLLRLESQDSGGRWVSQRLYRQNVTLSVVIPDIPAIKEIRLYHPDWNGKEFTLELVGAAPLP